MNNMSEDNQIAYAIHLHNQKPVSGPWICPGCNNVNTSHFDVLTMSDILHCTCLSCHQDYWYSPEFNYFFERDFLNKVREEGEVLARKKKRQLADEIAINKYKRALPILIIMLLSPWLLLCLLPGIILRDFRKYLNVLPSLLYIYVPISIAYLGYCGWIIHKGLNNMKLKKVNSTHYYQDPSPIEIKLAEAEIIKEDCIKHDHKYI